MKKLFSIFITTLFLTACSRNQVEIMNDNISDIKHDTIVETLINNDKHKLDETSNSNPKKISSDEMKLVQNNEDKVISNESDDIDVEEETNLEVTDVQEINVRNYSELLYIKALVGSVPDLSKEKQEKFKTGLKIAFKVSKGEIDFDSLSEREKKLYDSVDFLVDFLYEDEYDAFWYTNYDFGCSWYCGVGSMSSYASSSLEQEGDLAYDIEKIHDGRMDTAWVEGVDGNGIGEFFEIRFDSITPMTDITIWNGYMKNNYLYYSNNRAKKLKLYINNIAYAILELEDSRAPQRFDVELIQKFEWENELVLKFEILEIYQGSKWDDTCITDIKFDGYGH